MDAVCLHGGHRDETHNYAIIRGVRPKKPKLDDDDIYNRWSYTDWLLDEFNLHFPKLVFVCYDETTKAIGGVNYQGGKQKISRPKGQNANNVAVHVEQPKFSLMICATTSSDTTVNHLRPCVV